MRAERPFASIRDLFRKAGDAWWGLDTRARLEAYAAHPRIGGGSGKKAGPTERREQSGVDGADATARKRLVVLNNEYFAKHGFIFLVSAAGKSAAQMLEILAERVKNTKSVEIENAAAEQAKITRLRLEKWLQEPGV